MHVHLCAVAEEVAPGHGAAVDVDLEFFDPAEQDFHALRLLLQVLAPTSTPRRT